ncbi:MAG: hypothetical protein BroJett038_23800 [Chloroflexota bacterium]|nr:MAG: hypothetical protein BroJett038_23800 [Chloroflexota bacterium]
MRHYFGLSEYYLRQQQKEVPIFYDPDKLINCHLLLCGMSGTGKSFQTKRLLRSAAAAGVEIDVFDVHEELDDLPGCVAAKYSQATSHGFNPLVLDTDPHVGGVNRQADFIVGLIRQVTTQFGSKQEAALRNLIIDTYASRGIFADNQRTWLRQELTERQRQGLIADRKWSELRNYYPTLNDLLDYAEKKVLGMMFGGDNKAMAALESLCKFNTRLQSLNMRLSKTNADEEVKKLEEQVASAAEKCVQTYTEAVACKPGREPKDLIKYDSRDVLVSVIQRLTILAAAGIFNSNPPDFRGSKVRVHQTKSLSDEQQILFTKLRLRGIFEEVKKLGPVGDGPRLRRIVFLDEAPKYFTEDKDDIINVVAREARKFGLGLWCAAQQPTAFPEDFLTNCGASILLGIHSAYWKGSVSKLRITEDALKWIKPKEVIAIKLQKEGQADPAYMNVAVPNPDSDVGRRAAAFADARR